MKKHITIILVILGIFILCSFSSCTLGRFIFYNVADIQDHKKFPSRSLVKQDTKEFEFKKKVQKNTFTEINVKNKKGEKKTIPFDTFLEKHKTVAFLVIQDDTIQYERYFKKYTKESIVPSFSMAKSVISILIGCAIEDRLIHSVNDPVTAYLPHLATNGFDKVNIEHLLQMTSGLNFNEGYTNPFGHAATFYYGLNLRKVISKLKLKTVPGQGFDYVSGNTQLLGAILEKVLKNKTITTYFQEKIWSQLDMEYDASWSLDKKKNGMEKTFCCINARARDYAKIGRLYLNKGNWNGKQLVPENWVISSTKVDENEGSAWYYQYQWWLPSKDGDFMAQGILGQYIYVNPAKKLIIIRLGKNTGGIRWGNFFVSLASNYR